MLVGWREPQKDTTPDEIQDIEKWIEPGTCYLIKEKRTHVGFLAMSQLMRNDWDVMMIIRENPVKVRKSYTCENIPIHWLTSNMDTKEQTLGPQQMSRLSSIITKHLKKGETSALLLDGFEYLETECGFDILLNVLHLIHDKVMVYGSNFFMSLDPQAIEKKKLSLIEKEFSPLGR